MPNNHFQKKSREISDLFSACHYPEQVYDCIIALGRAQKKPADAWLVPCNLVEGCQSKLWLHREWKEGKLYFDAFSEALISAGLAQLLIRFYDGATPEEVLTVPPSFLEELRLPHILSPGRANGLYGLHLKMKQAALEKLLPAT